MFRINEADSRDISLFKLSNSQWNIPRLRELLEDGQINGLLDIHVNIVIGAEDVIDHFKIQR